jgi:hypothetical protein
MLKLGRFIMFAFVFAAACALAANAQEPKKEAATKQVKKKRGKRLPGEPVTNEGTIVKVDQEKKELTIRDDEGKVHNFMVDENVKLTGPRGGKVAFTDKRVRPGMSISWLMDKEGKVKEINFPVDRVGRVRQEAGEPDDKKKEDGKKKDEKKGEGK